MTNIREEFEHFKYMFESDYDRKPTAFNAYQAAHEAQQVRIDDLLEQIEELKSSIKTLCVENDCMGKSIESSTKHSIEQMAKITALEARCKELEDALSMLTTTTKEYKDMRGKDDVYESMHKQAWNFAYITLSTKSPTGNEMNPTETEEVGVRQFIERYKVLHNNFYNLNNLYIDVMQDLIPLLDSVSGDYYVGQDKEREYVENIRKTLANKLLSKEQK